MDRLPTELKLHLLKAASSTDLPTLLSLSTINSTFYGLYSEPSIKRQLLQSVAARFIAPDLVEICWTLNLFPHVRQIPAINGQQCSCGAGSDEEKEKRGKAIERILERHERSQDAVGVVEIGTGLLRSIQLSSIQAMIRLHASMLTIEALKVKAAAQVGNPRPHWQLVRAPLDFRCHPYNDETKKIMVWLYCDCLQNRSQNEIPVNASLSHPNGFVDVVIDDIMERALGALPELQDISHFRPGAGYGF